MARDFYTFTFQALCGFAVSWFTFRITSVFFKVGEILGKVISYGQAQFISLLRCWTLHSTSIFNFQPNRYEIIQIRISSELWGAWQFLDISMMKLRLQPLFEFKLLAEYNFESPCKNILPINLPGISFQCITAMNPPLPRSFLHIHLGEVLTYFCIYVTWNYTMRDNLLCGWKCVCVCAWLWVWVWVRSCVRA